MRTIDLNADVGEGLASDAELIPLVTSVNIACGGHAGDDDSMQHALCAAFAGGAIVGAHPGHADPEHFGRRDHVTIPTRVEALVRDQLARLDAIARRLGVDVAYLKPHGALYHQAGRDRALAEAVVAAAARRAPDALAILGQAGSALEAAAKADGLPFFAEAFADRAYLDDGSLAPRGLPGAVLTDEDAVVAQAVRLARDGVALSLSDREISVRCDSLCLHGDGVNAVALAHRLRAALLAEGISLRAFCV